MTHKTPPTPGHAGDLLGQARSNPLDAIFSPKSVAVIGASAAPRSVGRALMENLKGFEGRVYPVNLKHAEILGIKAYPDVGSLPEKVDLAVIATPASTVPKVVRECAKAEVRGAVIISAGFKESGPAGLELEQQVLHEARHGGMRLIGPNCLGVMIPRLKFNATFADGLANAGHVCFLSQSGALCTAVLDWSRRENVGFSAFVSVGSLLDVNWGDLISYFGDDPRTRSIVCYMESIGNARSFLSAAREVALTKPIIILKVGRTEAAARAAASHTGSLTGSDEVLQAAFRRVGVLRVNAIEEVFDMTEVLAKQPLPRGPRLAIVTNAGGPGALATDRLVESGGQLAGLSEATLASLDSLLPAHWSHGNPIDILGDASPDRYAEAVGLAAKEPNADGVLVILTPQAMTDATATADQLRPFSKLDGKPILASWMGGPAVEGGEWILNKANIPTFKYPDRAARAFALMWRHRSNLHALYETPALAPSSAETASARDVAGAVLKSVRDSGRTLLTEVESKQILAAYEIPTVKTLVALDMESAVAQAERLGFPVVLKLHSQTLTHKTDVGGVHLDIRNAAGVQAAWRCMESSVRERAGSGHFLGVTVQPMVRVEGYELILGSSVDPQFGPVLLFGAGGQLVEVMKDRALAFPPLNGTLARRMIEQTRIFKALQGVRGRKPVDLAALEQLIVRFSHLVAEHPRIKEIDINPLLASPDRLLALDARIVLHDPAITGDLLPKLAIRAYPIQYVVSWKLSDDTPVLIRPIRPEDEPLMVKLHHALSERSVYQRYFTALQISQRITHERLSRLCFIDYDREMALVAEYRSPGTGELEILGVGRISKLPGTDDAEFAIVVADQWQRRGLGTQMLKMLTEIARKEGLARMVATILPDNREMQRMALKSGFQIHSPAGSGECRAELALRH